MFTLYLNGNHLGTVRDSHAHLIAQLMCQRLGDVVVMWGDEDTNNSWIPYIYYRNSQGVQSLSEQDMCQQFHQESLVPYIDDHGAYGPYLDPKQHASAHATNVSITTYELQASQGWENRSWTKRQGRRAERRMLKHADRSYLQAI